MNIEQLAQANRESALAIMADKSLVAAGKPDERADQLVIALRHVICCAVLLESSEEMLHDMAARYGFEQ